MPIFLRRLRHVLGLAGNVCLSVGHNLQLSCSGQELHMCSQINYTSRAKKVSCACDALLYLCSESAVARRVNALFRWPFNDYSFRLSQSVLEITFSEWSSSPKAASIYLFRSIQVVGFICAVLRDGTISTFYDVQFEHLLQGKAKVNAYCHHQHIGPDPRGQDFTTIWHWTHVFHSGTSSWWLKERMHS